MKRYVHEKIAFIQTARIEDEHVLIIPGAKDELIRSGRSRIYTIRSPLVSRTAQYRILLNLSALDEIIAREKPDIIESGDPYQVGWKAARVGRARRIPTVAFYHSHFTEAYLRGPMQKLGRHLGDTLMKAARAYVPALYNRFDATLVPSAGLSGVLRDWGVTNTRPVKLGVNTEVFRPMPEARQIRETLNLPQNRMLLLYVGRLAREKNTKTLFEAFGILRRRCVDKFHLLVIGDGQEREKLRDLQADSGQVSWIPYCADSEELARYYRAADLFVHPGIEETFGLVALESEACGTPVAGFRGTYMDEVILHNQSAWPTENSPVALADAIEAMSMQDLPLLGKTAAALVAQRYTWSRVFEELFSIYHEVVAGYRRASG